MALFCIFCQCTTHLFDKISNDIKSQGLRSRVNTFKDIIHGSMQSIPECILSLLTLTTTNSFSESQVGSTNYSRNVCWINNPFSKSFAAYKLHSNDARNIDFSKIECCHTAITMAKCSCKLLDNCFCRLFIRNHVAVNRDRECIKGRVKQLCCTVAVEQHRNAGKYYTCGTIVKHL